MEIMFWFFIKHFICDFPLQAHPWMYRNKGTYGHPGGIVHALIHFIGTFILLLCFNVSILFTFALSTFDFICHYHIDYAKLKIGSYYKLGPMTSEWFWILLGVDQLLHYLTYFIIILML